MPVAVILHAIIVARIISLLYENKRSSTLSYSVFGRKRRFVFFAQNVSETELNSLNKLDHMLYYFM
jgi:hypothetical protein